MTVKAFRMLMSKCTAVLEGDDPILAPVTKEMKDKLQKYDGLLCCEVEHLAQILNSRFGSDLLSDSEVLRQYVVLPSTENDQCVSNFSAGAGRLSRIDFMHSLLNDDLLQDTFDEEVIRNLRATLIGDKRTGPFEWSKANE